MLRVICKATKPRFEWSREAIRHANRGPRAMEICKIEDVLLRYRRNANDVQVVEGNKPNTRVFQAEQKNQILRIVVDITTHPWTIITFYPAKKQRYWLS